MNDFSFIFRVHFKYLKQSRVESNVQAVQVYSSSNKYPNRPEAI